MPTFSRPDGDQTVGNWTATPLWQKIDEETPSDTDFVRSELDPANDIMEVTLEDLATPSSTSGYVLRIRAAKGETGGGQPGTINMVWGLYEGTTLIVESTENGLPTSFATFTIALSLGEAGSISDYDDLRIRVDADKSAGARDSWLEVSWAEFETPSGAFGIEQAHWRWFEDGTGSLTPLADENVKPTLPGDKNQKMVRLRVQLEETGAGSDTDKIVAARMSGDDGVTWETMLLDNRSDDDKHLVVGDGADVAGDTITSQLLTDTDTSGKYHETQVLTESLLAVQKLEVDFSLRTRVVVPDKDYRFELLWDGTPVALKGGASKIELRGSTAATRETPVQPDLTNLTSGNDATDATSIATASIAPSANSLVIATVATRKAAGPQNIPTLTGAGMTWVQVRDFFYDDAGEVGRLTQFRALDASPGSGALTFDYAGQTQKSFVWTVVEFDNVDTSGSNGSGAIVQEAQDPPSVGSHTSVTIGLADFTDRGVSYGVAVKESAQDADMVGDLPEMIVINEEADTEDDQRLIDQWKQGMDASITWDWGTARRRVGFAMEIKSSEGAGPNNSIDWLDEPASGDPNTMAGGHGQRGFFDGTNWWAFYIQDEGGSSVEYKHTDDLATGWLPATAASVSFTAAGNPEDFNIIFREIGGTKYVMVVVENSNTHRYFKRGTISGTTITWDSTEREVTTVDSSNNGPPGVVLDDGNFVWFAGKGGTVGQELWAQRSVNTFDNATYYTFNTVHTVSEADIEGTGWDPPELIGLASSEILIAYPDAGNINLRARKCTESGGMGSPVTLNVSTDGNRFEWNMCRGTDGNVYFIYGTDDTNNWAWALRVYSISGDSWTTGTSPDIPDHGGTANDGFLCYWGADDRLYVFDTVGDRNSRDTRTRYKSYSGGTSGTWDESLRFVTAPLVGNSDHWDLILNEDGSKALMVMERGDDTLVGTHYVLEYYVLDTPALGGDSFETATEAVGVTDSTTRIAPAVRSLTDPVGVTDSTTPVKSITVAITDPVGVTDSTFTDLTSGLTEAVIDPVGVTDSSPRVLDTVRAITDAVGVTDSTPHVKSGDKVEAVTEPVGVTDASPRVLAIARTIEAQYLLLPDPDLFPDNYARTPSHASLDITEDIELISYSGSQHGEDGVLLDKLDVGANQDGYAFWIDSNESPLLRWGDGTTIHNVFGDVGWPNLVNRWARATLVVDNGSTEHVATFYISTDPVTTPIDDINWTQWSQHIIAGVTDIQTNTLPLNVGRNLNGSDGGEGKHYRGVVRDGIGGTIVANFDSTDFNLGDSDTDTGVDTTGKTWTIFGTVSIIGPLVGATDVVTPVKAIVKTVEDQYLELDGASNSNVQTPHHASQGITGDLDLRFEAALDNWADGTIQVFVSKYRASSGNRAYRFYSSSGGSLVLAWSEDGDAVRTESVPVPAGWLDFSRRHGRVTMDVDNEASDAEIIFYESSDGIVWTQVGATQFEGVTTSIHNATASDIHVGTNSSGTEAAKGKFYSAQVRDGIDGTLVANFDAEDFDVGDTEDDTAVDSTGKTWTIDGPSSLIGPLTRVTDLVEFTLEAGLAVAVTDPIGVTDSTTRIAPAIRTIAEPIGVTDSTTPIKSITVAITETMGVTDSTPRVAPAVRSVAEGVAVADATSDTETNRETLTEPVGVTDSTTRVHTATRTPIEAIGVTDDTTPVKSITVAITDPVGVTDSTTSVLQVTVEISEDLGVTDSTTRIAPVIRAITEALAVQDATSDTETNRETLVETVGVIDSTTRVTITFRSNSDDMGVTDSTTSVKTITIAITDPVGVTDDTAPIKTIQIEVSEALGVTDSTTRIASVVRSVIEAVAVADATSDTEIDRETLTEPVGVTDLIARIHTALRSIVEAVGVTDSTTTVKSVTVAITEAIGVTDSTTSAKTIIVSISEALGVTDSTASSKSVTVAIVEALGVTDSTPFTLEGGLTEAVVDPIGVTDSTTQVHDAVRSVVEAIGVTDAIAPVKSITVSITEAVGVTDATPFTLQIAVAVSDDVGVIDSTTRVAPAVRPIVEGVAVQDAISDTETNRETLTEPIGVTDLIARVHTALRSNTDDVGVTDLITAIKTIQIEISESLGLTDLISPAKSISTSVIDPIGVTDSTTPAKTIQIEISESVGVTDVVADALEGGLTEAATDPIGLTDSTTRAWTIVRSITETVGVTDLTIKGEVNEEAVAESVGVTDTIDPAKATAQAVVDDVGVTDSIEVALTITVVINEDAGVTDDTARSMVAARALVEDVGVTTTLARVADWVRILSDNITVTDAVLAIDQAPSSLIPYSTAILDEPIDDVVGKVPADVIGEEF